MVDLKNLVSQLIVFVQGIFSKSVYTSMTELSERQRVQQLLDYYKGNQIGHLKTVLNSQFANPAALKMQPSISNVVKYIADTLANTFKHGIIVDAVNDKEQDVYDEIVKTSQLDIVMQNLEKLLFVCKTMFVKVSWRDEGIKLDLVTPQFVVVNQNNVDPLKYDSIIYPTQITGYNNWYPQGQFAYWTPESFTLVNEKGVALTNEDNPTGVNPYGVIPIVTFRESLPSDNSFFVYPGEELVSAQDTLNVFLTELNQLIKMQSFSVPVITNPSKDAYGNVNINIDPSKPIIVDADKDRQGKFEFVSPDAKIAEVQESVDSCYLRTFSFYGVSPAEFVRSSERMSAESIKELHSRIDEYRQTMKIVLMPQVQELFDVIRKVYNAHSTTQLSEDGVNITVQTSKLSYGSMADKWTDYDRKLQYNMTTLPEIMVKENDDMTIRDAEETLAENAKINAEYKDKMIDAIKSANTASDNGGMMNTDMMNETNM